MASDFASILRLVGANVGGLTCCMVGWAPLPHLPMQACPGLVSHVMVPLRPKEYHIIALLLPPYTDGLTTSADLTLIS